MATYQELIDQRRMALRKTPPDLKKAAELLEAANKLVESGKTSEDEVKGSHY